MAGDLLTSGEPVLVAVADVDAPRAGLEELVAGLAPDGMAVASWARARGRPALARGCTTTWSRSTRRRAARADPLLARAPRAHLAWGPAEAEFALGVWRAELDLRPALGGLPGAARAAAGGRRRRAGAALAGRRAATRGPDCARACAVLGELALVEFALAPRACRMLEAPRTDLERSATFQDCGERLEAIERALAAELPARRAGPPA